MTGTCIRWCQICFNRPATNGVRCDDCAAAWRSPISRAMTALNTEARAEEMPAS
jgi:hypothetical protein